MDNTPDISFYFAVHEHMRADLHRYVDAVTCATDDERPTRLAALATWSKGFVHELEEHHYVEDRYFFPDMAAKVPSVVPVLDRLEADHRALDELIARWPIVSRDLADRSRHFDEAKHEACRFAEKLRDLLVVHLDVEDHDVLPLYWRHYSAEEYDAVFQQAVKKGKKSGLAFVAPWNVDCLEGEARAAFLAAAPMPLRVLHRIVRPRYDRLCAAAFAGVPVR